MRWTRRWQRILDGHAGGNWATPQAKRLLREALVRLTHGKCAFCESRLGVASWEEMEHYHPKSLYPELTFEWTNLFPVCGVCNARKGQQDHRGALLKPDEEDPERYFWVHPDSGRLDPALGLSAEERARTERTLQICDLQRDALAASRAELGQRLSLWIARVSRGDLCDRHEQELRIFLDPQAEYKLVIRHVFDRKGWGDLAERDRRRFLE
ncbi:MAG: TIGR02646 family protein [Acidobacteria bacterium]|nr:TIGR02646 family protein [Acidobacteriota bacterium]